VRNGVGERPDGGGAGGDGFRVGISTFVRLTSISSGTGLSGRFMVVLPVLGGEARDRVDDTEPRWLCDRIEGDGEIGLPALVEGPLEKVGACSGARYEAKSIKASATPSS